jgi:glutamyl/glutaminyl-tRNA synthetase
MRKIVNTRFNPTANGYLHLGHLMIVMLNKSAAADTGGKFIVRFDDDQMGWKEKLGTNAINDFCENMKEDLEWLNIKPDVYSYESKQRERNHQVIAKLDKLNWFITDKRADASEAVLPLVINQDRLYPYVPYLTAVKVVQDYEEGCNLLIRGEDLIDEFSLYCYFCQLLNFPIPEFVYVPKLKQISGSDLADVSKTKGEFSIRYFKEQGYHPSEIMDILEQSCLVEPSIGWKYTNIKSNPTIDF